jgi:hypothetical protein
VVSLLLSVTFACGLIIAGAHVVNRRFVAPVYDVAANLVAFTSATTASLLLRHWTPATLSAVAIACWLWLARRTTLSIRAGRRDRALSARAARGSARPGAS